MNMLPARAVLAFLLLPGVVAFLVPLVVLRPSSAVFTLNVRSGIPLAAGLILLFWCIVEFYRRGRGTLAPWDPPRALVAAGPYRYSRNPMYIGVLLILTGWALAFSSSDLGIYTAAAAVVFHLRVVLFEERWLERSFGANWEDYRRRVPRWLGIRSLRPGQ